MTASESSQTPLLSIEGDRGTRTDLGGGRIEVTISAGSEIDAWCTCCRMTLNHRVVAMVRDAGAHPVSADLTIVAERPSIAPAREQMRRALGAVLGVASERVSVKATRPEGLGLAGDGIGCLALVVLARS